jgi:hypothetical protein
MPEEILEEGREAGCHPAPIYLAITQDNHALRSILLFRAQPRRGLQDLTNGNESSNNSQLLSSNEIGFHQTRTSTSDSSKPSHSALSQSEPISKKHELISDTLGGSKMDFATRLEATFWPGEQLKHFFLEWLQSIPILGELFQIEAEFDSFFNAVNSLLTNKPIKLPRSQRCCYITRTYQIHEQDSI